MTRRLSLTPEQARSIRSSYQPGKRGYGYESLARQYGVSPSVIRDLLTNRTVGYAK